MNTRKILYTFCLFLLTTELNFCLTEKGYLVGYLRNKAKRYKNTSWLKESRNEFYYENKQEILRYIYIIKKEQKQKQLQRARQYEQTRSTPLFQTARVLERGQNIQQPNTSLPPNSSPFTMERQNAVCMYDWEEEST